MSDTTHDREPDDYDYARGTPVGTHKVPHLFAVADLHEASGALDPEMAPAEPVASLCNNVDSYGPFSAYDGGGEVCKTCERVRQARTDDT